ncbi:hypothetical protein [Roseomonas genomospecies 6]|uniref:Methyltransferase n=1 Tax=Roseomonas genomospecies 6 TaxID=214106 RepID=A0A9W7KPC3_9PROT|nr:hypothetical protein [Roseomonas genomospecies 6]KAA0676215.1 hypothetical protein DS843_28085 [Roseomonas genomospecies 6]
MGIANAQHARMLFDICAERRLSGKLVTLGKLSFYLNQEQFCDALVEYGMTSEDGQPLTLGPRVVRIADPARYARMKAVVDAGKTLSPYPWSRQQGFISDNLFFATLGFYSVVSVDYSDYDSSDVIFDLNQLGLAERIGAPADVVMDIGTSEHVFHYPNCLRNIVESVAVGGVILHTLPVNNQVDHGFYQFSPTLFHDFYSENGLEILGITVLRMEKGFESGAKPIMRMAYRPGVLDNMVGGFDDRVYTVEVLVRRTAASTSDRIPQQNAYRKFWDSHSPKSS